MAPKLRKMDTPPPFQRRIFLYGGSSSGKTHLIGTANAVERMRDVLVVPLDGGEKTLERTGVLVAEDARRMRDAEEILWLVAQKKDEFASVKTLVLDGISELAKRELQEIAELAAKNARPDKPRDRDMNQVQDHLLKNGRLMRLIRMARDIPGITLILTGWPKLTYKVVPDKDGKDIVRTDLPPVSIAPDFSDKMFDTVIGSVDECWFIRREADSRRFLYTSDYENIKAKTRGAEYAQELGTTKDGKFYPILVDPTFSDIVAAYDRAMNKQETINNSKGSK